MAGVTRNLMEITPAGTLAFAAGCNIAGTAHVANVPVVRPDIWQLLLERFRCPEDGPEFLCAENGLGNQGYFLFGARAVCFGQAAIINPAAAATDKLYDVSQNVRVTDRSIQLPFDPAAVLNNLLFERYCTTWTGLKKLPWVGPIRGMYYFIRPIMGVSSRRLFQKLYFRGWDRLKFPSWPVDVTVEEIFEQLLLLAMQAQGIERVPFIWFWPDGIPSCTIMTHDVETTKGRDFCQELMNLNDAFGIKSSFQIVPEKRYAVSSTFLENIQERGFEINVHDLNHDGRLMCEREEFLRRAQRINGYAKAFGAHGFRSAVMYRNVDWYDALDFSYDMSIPNVAHLDPQRGGCCTVMPFSVGRMLELPVTTTQDYTLFHVLNDYSIRLWKEQIGVIQKKHGIISFIVHPDYIGERSARQVYSDLLQYIAEMRLHGKTWIALPGEVADWWRLRAELRLVGAGGSWRIEGRGRERARLAYAVVRNGKLSYELG